MSTKNHALIIPGGGITPDNILPSWTMARLDKAIRLFTGSEFIITLSAGTVHKPPPLDKQGYPIYESHLAAKYLQDIGVPPSQILTEDVSLDTIGNAYFARTIHTDPAQFSKLAIITSEFHMPRTQAIFEWVYSLTPAPLDYQLEFIPSDNGDIDPKTLKLRLKRETQSLAKLNQTKTSITTLKQFHHWLFSQHQAYTFGTVPKRVTSKLLNSY